MFKFFSHHPPEKLNDNLPSLSEFDYLFRSLRSFSDEIINVNFEKSNDFFDFMKTKHSNEVFVKYVGRMIEKIKSSRNQNNENYIANSSEILINLNDILGGKKQSDSRI